MPQFTKDQLRAARVADLYDYLERHHAEMVKREGNSLRLKTNHSISIKQGYSGYQDFGNGETGNSVDFLVRHMDYSIYDAVISLCGIGAAGAVHEYVVGSNIREHNIPVDTKAELPSPADNNRRLYAYLRRRGISSDTIKALTATGRMYQDAAHGNIIFPSKENDWAEIHGTYTYCADVYQRIARFSRADGYWAFAGGHNPLKGYVTEASIDAISLFELHRRTGQDTSAYYISIGGVTKQAAINRIANEMTVVIAVDNDPAGNICREKNSAFSALIPTRKDWNEDLCEIVNIRR